MKGWWAGQLAAVVVVVAAVVGCGPEIAPDRPELGKLAPPYTALSIKGDSVSLESLRGKVVLLNFWATWCIPCRAETPFLQSLHERYAADGLVIVGASMDNRAQIDQIANFAEQYAVEYTVLHDPEMRGMDLYRVLGLPGSFLIDRDGHIQWMAYRAISEGDEEFAAALEQALR